MPCAIPCRGLRRSALTQRWWWGCGVVPVRYRADHLGKIFTDAHLPSLQATASGDCPGLLQLLSRHHDRDGHLPPVLPVLPAADLGAY